MSPDASNSRLQRPGFLMCDRKQVRH